LKVVHTFIFIFVLTASVGYSQAPPAELAEAQLYERAFLARDDGDGKPGEAATEFAPTDIPIHCVVVLSNASQVTVKMDLVAVSVAGVKHGSKVVSSSYTTKDLQDRVLFRGRPQGNWVAGAYRADIYIDGNLVSKLPFTILPSNITARPGLKFQPKEAERPRSATAKKT